MEWGMPSEKGILCKHRDMSCLYWILVQPLNCFCAQEQSYYRVEKILILDGKYWDEQLGTAGGTHKGYHLLTYIRDQGWWALDAFGRCFNLRVLIWIYSMEQAAKSLGATAKTIPVQNVPPVAGVGKRWDFHVQYTKVLDAAKSTSQLLEQPWHTGANLQHIS